MSATIVPVLLAGGEGKRLWPLSSSDRPKQFLKLNSTEFTLFQLSIKRALMIARPENIITVTAKSYAEKTCKQLEEVDYGLKENVILEPRSRNTAAAIAMAANYAKARFENPILWILPSDHAIDDDEGLKNSVEKVIPFAEQGKIICFGVNPSRSDNNYGYILAGNELQPESNLYSVSTFINNPEGDMLRWAMQQKNCLWNSGIFLMQAETLLSELASRDELTYKLANISYIKSSMTPLGLSLDPLLYEAMPQISIEKVIMEQSKRVCVSPIDIGWSDVSSWYSLWEMSQKEGSGEALDNFLTKIASV